MYIYYKYTIFFTIPGANSVKCTSGKKEKREDAQALPMIINFRILH